jgi:hypothetical protein
MLSNVAVTSARCDVAGPWVYDGHRLSGGFYLMTVVEFLATFGQDVTLSGQLERGVLPPKAVKREFSLTCDVVHGLRSRQARSHSCFLHFFHTSTSPCSSRLFAGLLALARLPASCRRDGPYSSVTDYRVCKRHPRQSYDMN